MKVALNLCATVAVASAACPYEMARTTTTTQTTSPPSPPSTLETKNAQHVRYLEQINGTDWEAVKRDIGVFLTTSQEAWPADYGNYGPLFVRLAWHNSGSYRTSDGRGGVDGARQRFDPERSWADNTNLDKARSLLFSVKQKHPEVSWGDLIVLTGTEAVRLMGGPVLGFCSGRIDDADGSDSLLLGPSPEQETYAPCAINGTCEEPLGSTTVGLIYVNPEGVLRNPDAYLSSIAVRDAFGRMSMNDSETVALIGGGHTFGKAHGACTAGAGSPPRDDPANPWPGKCGSGHGVSTFTSGIEGAWTTNPTTWDNEYFHLLQTYDWMSHYGPGGAWQWQVKNEAAPQSPKVDGSGVDPTMMMTTDVALTADQKYSFFVKRYAKSLPDFETAFAAAWYKLMTRDMGPRSRCGPGEDLPPAQEFQHALATVDVGALDYEVIDVVGALRATVFNDKANVGPAVKLAYACAATFRYTDYLGGCNGARIRFAPATTWASVKPVVDEGLATLQTIKDQFSATDLTWADLIVLAGGVALEIAAGVESSPTTPTLSFSIQFCGGRADDSTGDAWQYLEPTVVGAVSETADQLKETIQRTGLTNRDYVALLGARRSLGPATPPFYGNYTADPTTLDNGYFKDLLANTYVLQASPADPNTLQYKAQFADLYAQSTDLIVKFDAELGALVQDYSLDNDLFLADLAHAWTKLMNADRFDRPLDCLPLPPGFRVQHKIGTLTPPQPAATAAI